MKILVGISGASGVELGFLLLKNLEKKAQTFCVVSENAKLSFISENKNLNIKNTLEFGKEYFKLSKTVFFENSNLSAEVSSGSFGIKKTIIAPCSINTLAKINSGICDNLLTRSAAVALKEGRDLILAVREMPFSTISLEQMARLSSIGVKIAPPIYASYAKLQNLSDFKNFIIGKWLDLLDIEHNLYQKWQG